MKKAKKGAKKASHSKLFPYEPMGDRVLIKEIEGDESGKTKSGIYIPDSANKDGNFKKGKVIAVGAGRFEEGKLIPPNLSVGDIVSYQWGEKVSLEGVEYFLVREGEIAMKHK